MATTTKTTRTKRTATKKTTDVETKNTADSSDILEDSSKEKKDSNTTTEVDAYEHLKKENELLQQNMALMMQKFEELQKQLTESQKKETINIENTTTSSVPAVNQEENTYKEINPLKPIKVISLSTGGVTLRTSPDGKGNVLRFNKFGQVRYAPYQDLQTMITVDRSFIEEGMVYICDKDVIKNNYLEDAYSKFISKNTMEHILELPIDKIAELIANTTISIQNTVIELIIRKINNNEPVDMNKVAKIGEVCDGKPDIMQLAMLKRTN